MKLDDLPVDILGVILALSENKKVILCNKRLFSCYYCDTSVNIRRNKIIERNCRSDGERRLLKEIIADKDYIYNNETVLFYTKFFLSNNIEDLFFVLDLNNSLLWHSAVLKKFVTLQFCFSMQMLILKVLTTSTVNVAQTFTPHFVRFDEIIIDIDEYQLRNQIRFYNRNEAVLFLDTFANTIKKITDGSVKRNRVNIYLTLLDCYKEAFGWETKSIPDFIIDYILDQDLPSLSFSKDKYNTVRLHPILYSLIESKRNIGFPYPDCKNYVQIFIETYPDRFNGSLKFAHTNINSFWSFYIMSVIFSTHKDDIAGSIKVINTCCYCYHGRIFLGKVVFNNKLHCLKTLIKKCIKHRYKTVHSFLLFADGVYDRRNISVPIENVMKFANGCKDIDNKNINKLIRNTKIKH